MRHAPIQDDDERFERTSYSKNTTNSVGEAATARANRANISDEPPTYEAAMSSPEAAQWQIACTEELQSLQDMKVYEEVPRPPDRKIVDSRWTFKLKRGPEGLIERFKGRVVTKGYTQVEGLDYDEMFAPVVNFTSIHTLLALAAHLDLEIHQVDIKTAFLNGKLNEEIYLRPPPGANTDKSLVWHLHRPLYRLKQSSRQWYQEVYAKFTNLGFTRLEADHSIFQRGKGSQLIIVAIYVNDMLIFAESINILMSFNRQLSNTFPISDLSEARWILNMEIIRNQNDCTISISQERYVETILECYSMSECHPVATPMVAGLKLQKLDEAESDTSEYQKRLGSLMYAMLGTHPELAHPIAILSQHSTTPGPTHFAALNRVFRYLRGASDMKLIYCGKPDHLELSRYIDADWANDINDRRSVGGHVFLLTGGAISWSV
jgi:hypothetical protein